MAKKCAYSFWGFMADKKVGKDGNEVSSPDGTAFYSWCIINELLSRGYNVVRPMPDRDNYPKVLGNDIDQAFKLFAKDERYRAWLTSSLGPMDPVMKASSPASAYIAAKRYVEAAVRGSDFVLHEWRMPIPNRNDYVGYESTFYTDHANWQPDLLFQECIIDCCAELGVELVILDLDYKLDVSKYRDIVERLEGNVRILELGSKWGTALNASIVYIPFDWSKINTFKLKEEPKYTDVVYVGNRYERDDSITKYMPDKQGYIVRCYGNWLTSFNDSQEKWPYIYFGKRLSMEEMLPAYQDALCTVLMAKPEYYEHGFMTARVIEAIFYGTVPLFAEEYGDELIKKYATEKYADLLTVHNADDVVNVVDYFREYPEIQEKVIKTLRDRLSFMDVRHFVDVLVGGEE